MEVILNRNIYSYTPEKRDPQTGDIVAANDLLGYGTFGKVYRAESSENKEVVAIKLFSGNPDMQRRMLDQLRREVSALKKVTHDNVVGIRDEGMAEKGEEQVPCLVMDYIEGQNLDEHWQCLENESGEVKLIELDWATVDQKSGDRRRQILWHKLSILTQVCDGLAVVHAAQIWHRDLKPSNIRIGKRDCRAVILDFGIARVLSQDPGLTIIFTETAEIKGTLSYMAPECFHNPTAVNQYSDIWALGVILYQSVTGRLPFPQKISKEVGQAVAEDEPEPADAELKQIDEIWNAPGAGKSLEAIWNKAMSKDSQKRHSSAGEFRDELFAWLEARFAENCGIAGAQIVGKNRVANTTLWQKQVNDWQKCSRLRPPIVAPWLCLLGGYEGVPRRVCMALPTVAGNCLGNPPVDASQWQILVDAVAVAVAQAQESRLTPYLPWPKHIIIDGDQVRILGTGWPYTGKNLANARALARLLLRHLTDIPDALREMLTLNYRNHPIAKLRELLGRASEWERMRCFLGDGPEAQAKPAAQELDEWRTCDCDLRRQKSADLMPLVERRPGQVPRVVELCYTDPDSSELVIARWSRQIAKGPQTAWLVRPREKVAMLRDLRERFAKLAAFFPELELAKLEDGGDLAQWEAELGEKLALLNKLVARRREEGARWQENCRNSLPELAGDQESTLAVWTALSVIQGNASETKSEESPGLPPADLEQNRVGGDGADKAAESAASLAQFESSEPKLEEAAPAEAEPAVSIIQAESDAAAVTEPTQPVGASVEQKRRSNPSPKPPESWPNDLWRVCWDDNRELVDFAQPQWLELDPSRQLEYAMAYQQWYAALKGLVIAKEIPIVGTVFSLRLIPPGRFRMGSPDGRNGSKKEPGRYDDETPHPAVISQPFYMGRTPVTQRQWEAVMGKNPAHFSNAGGEAPVESVSWKDCEKFFAVINDKSGRNGGFPSEAQWEYACRAGCSGMSYLGDFKIKGKNNAPFLDQIAWYGGNSGVDYDGGYDSSDWPEMQKPAPKSGTHPVADASKQANAWGLCDMLGNVYEWCYDWGVTYPTEENPDYRGPQSGSNRVCRGGAWGSGARSCRCARRSVGGPARRRVDLGVRWCLRS